jgi:hypothetical protein
MKLIETNTKREVKCMVQGLGARVEILNSTSFVGSLGSRGYVSVLTRQTTTQILSI